MRIRLETTLDPESLKADRRVVVAPVALMIP
jgi:hypothetical protein